MLGAGTIHRLSRRIYKLHMLDIKHILFAMERQNTRSERFKESSFKLLSMGAVYIVNTSVHVLLTIDHMAFV